MLVTKEQESAKELFLSQSSFFYFMKHCKLVETPTLDTPGGIVPFVMWPHQEKVAAHLQTDKLLVILKARQIGISWLLAAYSLWFALSKVGAQIMLFSKGEAEAIELLGKCRRLFTNLPPFLQFKTGSSSQTELSFPIMFSSVKAFAATESAGISYTGSVIVYDEWDEHPYAEENYMKSKPCRDAGGQFIGCFSATNMNPDTLAKLVYQEAVEGKNGFVPVFLPWDVRPGRDPKWWDETERSIPQKELSRLTPDLYMRRNYPATAEDAFRLPSSSMAFNPEILDGLKKYCLQPTMDGVAKIYQDYLPGGKYIAASDTSHGVGKDFSVTVIMDLRSGAIVADIMGRDLSPDDLALYSVKLLQRYNNPVWFPEDNDWGQVMIRVAVRLGYKNFGYQDEKKTKIGFHMGDVTRPFLWGELIPAINTRQIIIHNLEGLNQFYHVIRNPVEMGRVEAEKGRNDDYPVAIGICWINRHSLKEEWKPKVISSLHFGTRR